MGIQTLKEHPSSYCLPKRAWAPPAFVFYSATLLPEFMGRHCVKQALNCFILLNTPKGLLRQVQLSMFSPLYR